MRLTCCTRLINLLSSILYLCNLYALEEPFLPSPFLHADLCGRGTVHSSSICDPNNILSSHTKDILEGHLNRLRPIVDGAIAIIDRVSIQYRNDHKDDGLDVLSKRIANDLHTSWLSDRSSSFVFFVSIVDRTIHISTNGGIRAIVSDDALAAVINHMKPLMRAGAYNEALTKAILEIELLVTRNKRLDVFKSEDIADGSVYLGKAEEDGDGGSGGGGGGGLMTALMAGAVVCVIVRVVTTTDPHDVLQRILQDSSNFLKFEIDTLDGSAASVTDMISAADVDAFHPRVFVMSACPMCAKGLAPTTILRCGHVACSLCSSNLQQVSTCSSSDLDDSLSTTRISSSTQEQIHSCRICEFSGRCHVGSSDIQDSNCVINSIANRRDELHFRIKRFKDAYPRYRDLLQVADRCAFVLSGCEGDASGGGTRIARYTSSETRFDAANTGQDEQSRSSSSSSASLSRGTSSRLFSHFFPGARSDESELSASTIATGESSSAIWRASPRDAAAVDLLRCLRARDEMEKLIQAQREAAAASGRMGTTVSGDDRSRSPSRSSSSDKSYGGAGGSW